VSELGTLIALRLGLLVVLVLPAGCNDGDTSASVAEDSGAGREAASERPAPDSGDLMLRAGGWGPVRIGMTRAQVVASLGDDRNPEAVGGPDPARCDEFRPRRAPAGMLIMIERGVLTRITLTSKADVRTDAGVRVGDASAVVEAAYGNRLTSTPHYYLAAPARYLLVWQTAPPAEGARGIVYEIDTEDRVSRIHAGAHSITRVEGCV
jgi:hypothetical protein